MHIEGSVDPLLAGSEELSQWEQLLSGSNLRCQINQAWTWSILKCKDCSAAFGSAAYTSQTQRCLKKNIVLQKNLDECQNIEKALCAVQAEEEQVGVQLEPLFLLLSVSIYPARLWCFIHISLSLNHTNIFYEGLAEVKILMTVNACISDYRITDWVSCSLQSSQ